MTLNLTDVRHVHRHFYLLLFYRKVMKNIEEKQYSTIEEKNDYGAIVAAEPAVAYAAKELNTTGIVYVHEDAEKIDRIPLGAFGFYTDNPEVFENHIAEIEADMDKVDSGTDDPKKWISSEEMWTDLYQKYPWLR